MLGTYLEIEDNIESIRECGFVDLNANIYWR